MGKAASPTASKGGQGAKQAKPDSGASKKQPTAHAQQQQGAPAGVAHAGCACGGGCPRCAGGQGHGVPKPRVARRPRSDTAEAEARTLAPRLSLIGEPAAKTAEASGHTGAVADAKPAPTTADPARRSKSTTGATAAPAPPKSRPKPTVPSPTASPRPGLKTLRAPDPRLTRSRRLTRAERGVAETAMDIDLSEVRLHTGPIANGIADQAGALAFAHGNHIVLGARAERMAGASYARVLHHELIHVVQQSAPVLPQPSRHQLPQTRGPPLRPRIRAPPQPQCWFVTDAIGSFASDVGGAVYDAGADAVDGATDLAGDAVEFIGDNLKRAVDYVAPGLWDLLNGGVMKKLGKWLCQGVDYVLGALFGGLADLDIMTALEETFGGFAEIMTTLGSTVVDKLSDAAGAVLGPILDALDVFKPILGTIKGMVNSVTEVFGKVWDTIGVSAWKILETVGGAVWKGIKWITKKLWSGVKAVKDFAGWAWDELSDYFGIDWSGEGGVTDTLSGWASEVYDDLLANYEKIKKPLLTAGALFVAFSPLGPILLLTVVIPPLYEKIKWLIDNWDKAEIVVEAREILNNDIIPFINSTVTGFKVAAAGAAAWLGTFLGFIAGGLAKVVSAFSTGGCAPTVDAILANIADQLTRFETWANDGFAGLEDGLKSAFDAIIGFFKPIKDFIVALIQVSIAPFTLPLVIIGQVWLWLPERFKPPVIKFILDLLIGAVARVPTFMPGLFPLADIFKAGLLGFLRGLRSDEVGDERRVAASNKVAGIMRGSMSFIAGLTVGILRGMMDGIIDPFKLLFMLIDLIMKGVAVIDRAVNTLVTYLSPQAGAAIGQANLAISGPPPPAAAPAAAPAPADSAAPAAQTAATRGPRAPPQAAPDAAPAVVTSQLTRGLPATQAPTARTPGPAQRDQTAAPANTNRGPAGTVTSTLTRGPARPAAAAARAGPAEPVAGPASGPVISQLSRGPAAASANSNAAPAANTDAAPGDGAATASAQGPGADVTAEEGAGGDDLALAADVTDEAIIAKMSPAILAEASAAIAGEQDFTPESLETDMRAEVNTEGSTIAGLASLLGGAWDWILDGAGKVGRKASGWFMEFIELPNYKLGNKLGWLTGMILLELLISYFTAGGYMVIKEGAGIGARLLAYFVRYLDMGGAILGVMGKGLGRLRGPIMGGLDAAGGFLSRFKFLQGIMGKVRGGADWLFRFGDEIGAAADIARKGPIDGAAGRGAAGLGDDAAGGVSRALDGPAPVARAPDAPPARSPDAPPARGVDEAADGSRRTIDDPGHPTIRDDALRATEYPQAIFAAKRIAALNDAIDAPIPVVMGQLLYLKRRYRWIKYFSIRPISGPNAFRIGMVASPDKEVDDRYTPSDGDALIPVKPGVFKHPRGSGPRKPRQPEAPPPRDAMPDHTPGDGFDSDSIAAHFDEVTGGNGGMTPTGVSQNNRIPDFPRRTERHTKKVMDLENNRVFGGTNESFFTHFLDNGTGQAAQRFQRVAEQVHIRPIVNPSATGPARYGPKVIADNVVIDTHTGAFHILDAKTSARAPLTANQTPGYPNIAANGGRIESRGLPGGLGHHTEIPPTPVSRAEPNVNLKDPNAPVPPGGLDYNLTPIPPARPVNNVAAPVGTVTPPAGRAAGATPGPSAGRPVGQTADQAGARVGRDIVDGPPVVSRPGSVDTLPDGTARAVPDADVPTVRNPAAKLAELPQAVAAARAITEAADAIDLPIETVLVQLMLLKRRYRWIDTFHAIPRGAAGRFEIDLIASKHKIDVIEVDSIFLYHGSPTANARKLAEATKDRGKTFVSKKGEHDIGKGLYLFDNPAHAEAYAGKGGTIIELEVPLPHPDEIADISLRGFGRNGAPGAERDLFLREGAPGVTSADDMLAMGMDPFFLGEKRTAAKAFTTRQTADPNSPFSRNLARAQLFDGNLPDGAQLARGGLGFEFDVIQWRMRHPDDAIRSQIIEQVLGLR